MAPARLLLVDDDETVLSGLGVVLEAYQFEVSTASNVTEALKLIASSSFDVLLTDLHMPGAGDGLIVAGAMRQSNPKAVTLVLSANPDMAKATAAVLSQVDDVLVKPVRVAAVVEIIQKRLAGEEPAAMEREPGGVEQPASEPAQKQVELVATLLERERGSIAETWLAKMKEAGGLNAVRLSPAEQTEHLVEALNEVIYRLQYPQPLGIMTLFSMASLQHGSRRRRQGFPSPVLVEEARALQVAVFQIIYNNMDRLDVNQLPVTLMAIADELNAQLLQSLSGYENEKPVDFPRE